MSCLPWRVRCHCARLALFSLGKDSTGEDVDHVLSVLPPIVEAQGNVANL